MVKETIWKYYLHSKDEIKFLFKKNHYEITFPLTAFISDTFFNETSNFLI